MNNLNVSVIIPTYNESQAIGQVVTQIRSIHPDFQVIVVDDGSTDGTASAARDAGAMVMRHPYNIGNGAAVKTGIRAATGNILMFMDGDGQHDPKQIKRLLEHIPEYDMVVGARPIAQQASWRRAIGNKIYNWLASYVAKFPIKDLTSGFRAVKAEIAEKLLYLLPNSYSYPTTLTLGVLRNGMSVKYVPINVQTRQSGKSQIRLFKDGVRFFMIITKICTLYSPFRVFLPVSFLMFLLGAINYSYTYFAFRRFTNMSALLFITSLLIFMLGLISEQICQMRFERSEIQKRPKNFE